MEGGFASLLEKVGNLSLVLCLIAVSGPKARKSAHFVPLLSVLMAIAIIHGFSWRLLK